jgi:hypothetical protein
MKRKPVILPPKDPCDAGAGSARGLWRGAALLILSAAMAFAPAAPPVQAAQAAATPRGNVIVITDDRGGQVGARAAEIERLRAKGDRVEIRGGVCLSSCTMYLGLPKACVTPGTRFGFHGPSYFGAKLSPRDFDYWSNVIASHYPEPLRSWYMQEGRTRITTHFLLRGRDLIRMGIPRC